MNTLHSACINNDEETLLLLILTDDNLNINKRSKGMTCLHCACINGNENIVDLLIKNGINPHIKDEDGYIALDYAYDYGYINIAKKLLKVGLERNDNEIVELFISCFPDINNIDNNCINDDELKYFNDYGIFLLENGLSPNSLINKFQTIFGEICLKGYTKIAELMIEYNANVNMSDNNNVTLLMDCLDDYEITEMLLENKADVNLLDNYEKQNVLMHLASYKLDYEEHEDMFNLLIKHGADLNHKDKYGNNILHQAVRDKNIDYCKILIWNGLDPMEKNEEYNLDPDEYKNATAYELIEDLEISKKRKKKFERELKKTREEYLEKKRKNDNWNRRKDFMIVLSESRFKDESNEVVDTKAKIAGVKRNREYLIKQVFTVSKRKINMALKDGGEPCERIMRFI
jgi:ankyrin repeat protein